MIRPVATADAQELMALYDLLDDKMPLAHYPTAESSIDNYLQKLSALSGSGVWVFDQQGQQILGTYTIIILPLLVHDGRSIAIVESVVVHPRHHGEGIGSLLMQHAQREAQRAGCYKLMLSSNLRRQQAHKFYENIGFRQHGFSYYIDC